MSIPCSKCASPLPPGVTEDFCPVCSLAGALGEQERPGSKPPDTLRNVGDYELVELIARGGMGVVYRARQRSLGRAVAVKLMRQGDLADERTRQRFHAEAAAAARLQHPHIVAIHEVGEYHGQPFFSMDYIEGSTLAELVREQPLPARRAAELVRVVAEAVHYAHTQGVLHRDLKPSNVLLDTFGQPRVSDFGLAKALDSGLDLTHTSQVLGSPAYMPPEQAFSERNAVGPHSDVYSLGAILYQLLTARPPFQGESAHAVLLRLREAEPVAPRALNPDVPADLETICLKCLEKEPVRRYLTAETLANDLRRFLNDQPITARPVGMVGRTLRWARRHRGRAIAVVTALAALATVAMVASITSVRVSRARDSAEKARAEATRRLAESLVSEAHALRISGQPGFRAATLARLSEALALDREGQLLDRIRREAIAALMRPDLRHLSVTNIPPGLDLMHCCFDARFERCASATKAGRALYRLSDGALLQVIPRRGKIADEIVAFSPDSRFVVQRFGRATQLIEAETTRIMIDTNSADGPGAFSLNGKLFARGEEPGVIGIYDLARAPAPGNEPERRLTPSPSGGEDIRRTGEGEVRRPKAQTRSENPLPPAETARRIAAWPVRANFRVAAVTFDSTGEMLAAGDDGGSVSVRDASSGRIRWERRIADVTWHIAWSRDGETLAVVADRDRIFLLNAADGAFQRQLNTGTDISTTAAFSPEGDRLACAGVRSGARFFDVRSGKLLIADSLCSWHVLFDESGTRLGTFMIEGRPAWIEWAPPVGVSAVSGAQFSDIDPNLTFSADGNRLLANGANAALLWDVASRRLVRRVGHQSAMFISFGAGTNELLISTRNALLAQNLDSMLPNLTNTGIRLMSGDWLWGTASTRDGRTVAVVDHERDCVTVLNRQTGSSISLPVEAAERVAFSPDGRWLVSGAFYQGYVSVWDWQNNTQAVATLRPIGEMLAFSPDGQWLLTFGRNLRLWRTADWQPGPELPLAPNNPSGFAAGFSADGRWLAATQRDHEIHLIDLATRRTSAIIEPPGDAPIRNLAFQPHGSLLAVSLGHNEVQLVDLLVLRSELAKLGLDWQPSVP